MSINTAYFALLTSSIAVSSVKLSLIHMITVRERLYSKVFIREKDAQQSPFILNIFAYLIGAKVGPSFGGAEFCDRCERAAKNCIENEAMFYLMALAYGFLIGNDDSSATDAAMSIIKVFTIARVAHTIVYLLDLLTVTVIRGMIWTIGTLCNLALAVQVFQLVGSPF